MLLDNLFAWAGVGGTSAIALGVIAFLGLPALLTTVRPNGKYANLRRSQPSL